MSHSCMENRLSHYITLTTSEQKILQQLEASPEERRAGDIVFHEHDDIDYLYIVQKGWLISSTMLVDGERQILQLHFPGDMMGAASVPFSTAVGTLECMTDSTICRFPRSSLGELFRDEPRLSALFYAIAALENVNLCDRLKGLGRTNGKARLCSFFLSIFAHIRIVQGRDIDELEIPLRQRDLADAVGMSQVHIYRILSEMESEGLIMRTRRRLKILDEDRMAEIGQYENRYQQIDTSWFP